MTRRPDRIPARARRRGVAPLEVVMVTAIAVPMAIVVVILAVRACRISWRIYAPLIGYPYL